MKKVFLDSALQKEFDKNGYVVVDLFTEQEVLQLEKVYDANQVDDSQGLQLTVKNKDIETNKKIHAQSGEITYGPISRVLKDQKTVYSGFIAKLPRKPNQAGIHRDPTIVDETRYQSLVIWAPMVDIDASNGGIYMVAGSNRIFDENYKCFDTGHYDYKGAEALIQARYGVPVNVRRGQALIYDMATLHYSFQNRSEYMRLVYTMISVPSQAEVWTYHHNKVRNTIDIYAVDSDFILSYYHRYIDEGDIDFPLIKRFDFEGSHQISDDEFREAIESIGTPYRL